MSGKQSKRERKAQREAEREALRKQERQRTIFTGIVIAIVVIIGGVLVMVSLDEPGDVAEAPEGEATAEPTPTATTPERPVACGGTEPAGADASKPTFDEPEQVLEEGIDYHAVIETTCGRVALDLSEQASPEAVNSFVFLAQQGFFDGLEIFRNAEGIGVLQTGSGTNDASFQIGYQLTDELELAEEGGYPAGTLAMANSGPDTAGSQFFLVYDNSFDTAIGTGSLGPTYTRFGTVVEGLDVLQQISEIPVGGPRNETPQERVYMNSVAVGGPDVLDAPPASPVPASPAPASPGATGTPAPTSTGSPAPTSDPTQ